MSSSEENYDLDDISGDESEGYSPVSKKAVSLTNRLMLLVVYYPANIRPRLHLKLLPNQR